MEARLIYRPMRKPTCKLLLVSSLYWMFLELAGFVILLISYMGIANPTYEQQSFFMNNLIILAALSVPAVIAFFAAVLNWGSSVDRRSSGDTSKKRKTKVDNTLDSLEFKD